MTTARVGAREAGRDHHASRADEPRRRDRVGRRRRPVLGDSRAGRQRRRRSAWPCCYLLAGGADDECRSTARERSRTERRHGESSTSVICFLIPSVVDSGCTMSKWVLRGARVVDPATGRDGDLRRARRRHAHRARRPRPGRGRDVKVIDLPSGLVVCPGLIDMHVHLREPGRSTRKRWRPAPPRRSPAASRRSRACRTPRRSTTTPASPATSSRRRPRRTWRASIRSARSRAARRASSSPTSPS